MSKELWIEAYEELECELEREPTDKEVHDRYVDKFASRIDAYRDKIKYGEITEKRKK